MEESAFAAFQLEAKLWLAKNLALMSRATKPRCNLIRGGGEGNEGNRYHSSGCTMRDVIASIVPLWLIYVFFGVNPPVLVGYLIRRTKFRFARVIAPIAAITTAFIGIKFVIQQVVEPWILPGYVVVKLNERVPRQIDNVTTWEWTQFRNDTFIFFYRVTGPASAFESFDPAQVKEKTKESMCQTLLKLSEYGNFPKLETVYIWGAQMKTVAYDKADCPEK